MKMAMEIMKMRPIRHLQKEKNRKKTKQKGHHQNQNLN